MSGVFSPLLFAHVCHYLLFIVFPLKRPWASARAHLGPGAFWALDQIGPSPFWAWAQKIKPYRGVPGMPYIIPFTDTK